MATINANITIDLPDGVDFYEYIQIIKNQISSLTGKETRINIREVDDPISLSPITIGKIKE